MKRFALSLLLVLCAFAVATGEPVWQLEAGTMDLRDFAKQVSQITGRVVIFGADFKGEVELNPAKPDMNKQQLWEYFLSVLASQGWGVVVRGDVVQVVPMANMLSEDQPVFVVGEETPNPTDEMVTATFDLHHANAGAVAMQLGDLVSRNGRIVPIASQNRLVVVDTAANVERLRKIIQKLDAEGDAEVIRVVRLQRADALQITEMLAKIFTDYFIDGDQLRRRERAGGLIIVPEAEGRKVILRGNERDVTAAALLTHKIDEMDEPEIFIVRLRQAKPEETAKLLRDLLH